MHLKKFILACAAVVIISSNARGQSLTGTWTAEYPTSVRNVNGQLSSDVGVAVLKIEQKGDSIFGTWHPQNTPRKAEPRKIVGTFKDGVLNFVGEPVEATVRRGDASAPDQPVMMRSYFEAKLEGEALAGMMHSQSEDGSISSPALKWSAKRAAAGN